MNGCGHSPSYTVVMLQIILRRSQSVQVWNDHVSGQIHMNIKDTKVENQIHHIGIQSAVERRSRHLCYPSALFFGYLILIALLPAQQNIRCAFRKYYWNGYFYPFKENFVIMKYRSLKLRKMREEGESVSGIRFGVSSVWPTKRLFWFIYRKLLPTTVRVQAVGREVPNKNIVT